MTFFIPCRQCGEPIRLKSLFDEYDQHYYAKYDDIGPNAGGPHFCNVKHPKDEIEDPMNEDFFNRPVQEDFDRPE